MRRVRSILIAIVLATAALALAPADRARAASDDEARATFLLLLARYVTWPDGAFSSSNAPIVVAVVGSNPPLVAQLRALAAGQKVGSRGYEIQTAPDPAAAAGAHIVFVTDPDQGRAIAGGSPVRVAEEPDRLSDADIAIRMRSGRVAFAVNRRDVGRRGLRLSSKLMRLASSFE